MWIERLRRMVTQLFPDRGELAVRPLDTRERPTDRRRAVPIEIPQIRRSVRVNLRHMQDEREQEDIRAEFDEHRRTLEAVARAVE